MLLNGFDEKTNEHVFIIEYRTVAEGTTKSQPLVDPQQQHWYSASLDSKWE
jgi:hypothetical protein